MPEPIPYMGPEPGRWRRWVRTPYLVVVAILLLLLIPFPDPGRHIEHAWICAICASERRETEWRAGVITDKSLKQSSLDVWMQQHALNHVHDWRSIRYAMIDGFGRHRGSETSAAPAIDDLRSLVDDYVKGASTEQIKTFVITMQTGTEAEKKQAVSEACDIGLEQMEKNP